MTFEEFFIKKKIDLHQLKDAEPNLYREFESHYALMGEKSFDHTKKFWFNRLRKSFRLGEEVTLPKEKSIEAIQPSGQGNNQDSVLEKPKVTKPLGFKPRFKADQQTQNEHLKEGDKIEASAKATTETPSVSTPTGFKPRFKAGVTKSDSADTESKTSPPPVDEEKTPAEKTSERAADKAAKTTETGTKPLGFKPRFKAGVTKSDSAYKESKTSPPPVDEEKTAIEKTSERAADKATKTTETGTKPLGFKPRFKVKNTNKGTSTDEGEE